MSSYVVAVGLCSGSYDVYAVLIGLLQDFIRALGYNA